MYELFESWINYVFTCLILHDFISPPCVDIRLFLPSNITQCLFSWLIIELSTIVNGRTTNFSQCLNFEIFTVLLVIRLCWYPLLSNPFKTYFNICASFCQIMRDPDTGNSRGFGFISYDSFEASDAAIEVCFSRKGSYFLPLTLSKTS